MAGGEEVHESSGAESDSPDVAALASPTRSVFLSYASQDADVAGSICQFLEGRGVSCWMAPRDVPPGALYADAIIRGINEAKAIVLVLSGSAVASSHVGKEIERASSKRKPIIAFRVDAAALSPALEYFLSESQWIDTPALGMPAALAKLAEAVVLGSGPARAADPVVAGKPLPGAAARNRRVAVGAAAIVIGVSLAVALGVHLWSSSHSAPSPTPVARGEGIKSLATRVISDKSIAVLPFVDMSEKQDQGYFADGMAEEILNLLAQVPGLKVIGRTSSFQFKGKTDDLRKVGSVLGAAYLVEGSVRRSGDRMRIAAQLIDTRDGAHRWSQTYDRDAGDAIAVQDEIAGNVVRALQVEVAAFPMRVRPKNSEAYDHYLHGLHAFDRFDEQGFNAAIAEFRKALDVDPAFAPAAEQLAMTLWALAQWGFVPGNTGYPEARAAAEAAIRLDPRAADARTALAMIDLEYDCNWQAAERKLTTALKILPSDPGTLISLAQQRIVVGKWSDAAQFIDAALAADPLDASAYMIRLWAYLRSGRLPEAEAAGRRVLEISPTYAWAHFEIAMVLAAEGKYEEALAELQKERIATARDSGLIVVYQSQHRTKDAESALAKFESEAGRDYMGLAAAYTAFDKYDQAFDSLERARERRDPGLCYLKGLPVLKKLETDPRYKRFLEKINLPE